MRVTVQGKRNHVTTIARREDPRGLRYFWIEEGEDDWLPHDHSDYQACRDGYVSVTPLQPDMTAHAALATTRDAAEGRQPPRPARRCGSPRQRGTGRAATRPLIRRTTPPRRKGTPARTPAGVVVLASGL